jgi:hypothetical protein
MPLYSLLGGKLAQRYVPQCTEEDPSRRFLQHDNRWALQQYQRLCKQAGDVRGRNSVCVRSGCGLTNRHRLPFLNMPQRCSVIRIPFEILLKSSPAKRVVDPPEQMGRKTHSSAHRYLLGPPDFGFADWPGRPILDGVFGIP